MLDGFILDGPLRTLLQLLPQLSHLSVSTTSQLHQLLILPLKLLDLRSEMMRIILLVAQVLSKLLFHLLQNKQFTHIFCISVLHLSLLVASPS